MEDNCQVSDDLELLDAMISDHHQSNEVFHTTHYWSLYEKSFLPYLRTHGLNNFRSGNYAPGGEVFWAFGAPDNVRGPIKKRHRILEWLHFNSESPKNPVHDNSAERKRLFDFADAAGQAVSARPLSMLSASNVAGPSDIWQVNGNLITRSLLYYYLRYVFVAGHLDLSGEEVIVELGSGSGKQAEVLAKLYPDATILIFDIPPQLYVANQYLSTIFGDRVLSYRETKDITKVSQIRRGGIHIFPNWRFDLVRELNADLFWSTATFGEMEPEVVLNYLKYVQQSTKNVYLMQVMTGRNRAILPWRRGVINPTTIEHYSIGLQGFNCVNREPASLADGRFAGKYEDSFWKRTPASGKPT
jgi:putative sugar O-methyltransferase